MFLDGVYNPPCARTRAVLRHLGNFNLGNVCAKRRGCHLDAPRSISVRLVTADRSCRNSVPVRSSDQARTSPHRPDRRRGRAPPLAREEVEPKLPLHPDRAAKRRSLESRARARGVTLAKIEPAERAPIPLGRFAEPEEPASAVAFLAPAAGCHLDDIEPTRGVPMPSTRRQALRAGAHDGLSARGSASRRGCCLQGS